MNETTDHAKASAVLRAEHQVILRVIKILGQLVDRRESDRGFEKKCLRRCVEFFRYFADACHHAKEEDLLFPVLESRGVPRENGPIGCMLEDHRHAREFTRQMSDALDASERGAGDGEQQFCAAARGYIELLTTHIFKEDNVLFNMGDSVMTHDDQKSLGRQFDEVAGRCFGGKKLDELEQIADELEARWPTK